MEEDKLSWVRGHQDKLRCEVYSGFHDAIGVGDTSAYCIGKKIILPSSFIGDPEIESTLELIPGQRIEDRPDIVSLVFHIKLMELINYIKEKQHFGKVKAVIYTIEFQKRGLLHAHVLILVTSNERPKMVADVDGVVSAEIPDINFDPFAYQSGCQYMIHGPFVERARSVKFLFKYIKKGHDRASLIIDDNVNSGKTFVREVDEVKTYLDYRYVSASEATWRIFKFDIQYRTPAIERLMFHLPGEKTVFFDDIDDLIDLQNMPNLEKSMFIEWMQTNRSCDSARELTYVEFPTKWVWDKGKKEWKVRQKGDMIGHIYYAHPTFGERFYLRMLLNIVKGPTSFEDIRTVDDVLYDNFKNACVARGLLEDDNERDEALNQAAVWVSPSSLRDMFVMMLMFCEVAKPEHLWEKHYVIKYND